MGGKKKSALNYPKIWTSHVEIINHIQPITIKSVFLNSFLIENKCLINLEHINLGTQEMSSREWLLTWHGTPHAACAQSQRLTENSQCKGQWMWWVGKKKIHWHLIFFKVTLFHCRPLNFIGVLKWLHYHPMSYYFQTCLLLQYFYGNISTAII